MSGQYNRFHGLKTRRLSAQLPLAHRHNPSAEPPYTVVLDRRELVAPGQVGGGRSTVPTYHVQSAFGRWINIRSWALAF